MAVDTRVDIWPRSGSAAFVQTDPIWRDQLAERLERDLRRHVIDCWFPRAIDARRGGFNARFDRRWQPGAPEVRSLESQARQTRTVARLGIAYPGESRWSEYALHGLSYLRGAMHDEVAGGWFWTVDGDGRPLAGGSKHAHGVAYLIGAAAETYRLTRAGEARELAIEALDWLDAHLHDNRHGGYHGWATRAGAPVRVAADVSPEMGSEPLGNQLGMKDANTHSDLLEAFALLIGLPAMEGASPGLEELYEIVARHIVATDGAVRYQCRPDWSAVPGSERFGYSFQIPPRMIVAGQILGRPAASALGMAYKMVDHAVERAWLDDLGGFAFSDEEGAPAGGGTGHPGARREWWVQTEAARMLILLALLDRRPSHYRDLAERLVRVIEKDFLDPRHGGWYSVPPSGRPLVKRLLRPRELKATMWKDASHEADFYLDSVRMLRGLGRTEPLSPPERKPEHVDPNATA